jgi:multidrug efflux pump subunit AcrA (membrane-fusion protein)/transcriptional regulator with GAF, ATPase, and Fis domain
MSTEQQSVDPELVEQTKQQIRGLVREIAQISKSDIAPVDFYDAVLSRIVTALAAVGGAIWTVTENGQLSLEYEINLRETRLAESEDDQVRHGRLLRKVMDGTEGMLSLPHSGSGDTEGGGNPTDFLLVLGPLKTANETAGVLEIFQRPHASPTVQRGYLRFLLQMCELCSEYLKSRKLQHFTDRQTLWSQLENFTRLVHQGLNSRATSYTIANEGRRLIECDRVSVAINKGRKCRIEAVSGQDTFDRRSNTVSLLTRLANAVVATGETVWYTGDTSMMAPQVEDAVHEYVDEVHSKAVAIVPLKEPHDKTDPTANPKVLGALIIEQIEDSRPREGLLQRIDVVSEHSSIALANALEHQELFLMPVWRAIGKARWVVEARQLPYTISIGIALVALSLFLALWPADFELSARGTLEPVVEREIFSTQMGRIVEVPVKQNQMVKKGDVLARIRNSELESKILVARGNLLSTQKQIAAASRNLAQEGRRLPVGEKVRLEGELNKLRHQEVSLKAQLDVLLQDDKDLTVRSPIDGQVATWQVHDILINRPVNRGDILMTIVEPQSEWQLEVLMPEKYMGYINQARREYGESLPVEYITATQPGVTRQGKIKEVARTAEVVGEEGNTVLIRVAIDKKDLDTEPRPGATVTAKVFAGKTSLGYDLFHDLITFFQTKVLFRLW